MNKITVVFFGDSNTKGYQIKSHEGFCERLSASLPKYYPAIRWHIHNAGENGDTSQGAIARLGPDVLAYNPTIVFLMFGTNDSSFGVSLARYEQNLNTLATRIKAHNNQVGHGLNSSMARAIFITPPIFAISSNQSAAHLDAIYPYNAVVKKTAKQVNSPCIDLYQAMLDAKNRSALLQPDGYHLSASGHSLLYDIVFLELAKRITPDGMLLEVP